MQMGIILGVMKESIITIVVEQACMTATVAE